MFYIIYYTDVFQKSKPRHARDVFERYGGRFTYSSWMIRCAVWSYA